MTAAVRAISVRQPWAWAIVHGGKDVENRSRRDPWRSAVGERVYIHAAKTVERGVDADVARLAGQPYSQGLWLPLSAGVVGALIGTAVILDVHFSAYCVAPSRRYCSPWAQAASWHIVLGDVEALPEPIPYRGALGLFDVTTT